MGITSDPKPDRLTDTDTAMSTQEEFQTVPGVGNDASAATATDGRQADDDDDKDALGPVVTGGGTVEMVNDKPVFKPTRSFYLAFSALLVLTLAVAIDATSLSVALPTISSDLGGSALEAFWSGTSFLLASTVLQPPAAALSSIFGRKYIIYGLIALFAAGSLIGALAKNFGVLIAGRTIQGVGGGGLIALTEVVMTDLVPLAFRPTWFSVLSAMWSIGTVTGPLIGAGFTEDVTWRWILYINLPMIGVGLVFIVLFLHQAKIPGGIFAKLARFDWIGSFLFTASATSFLYGLTTGGVAHPWDAYQVLVPLIIGPFGLLAFGAYEFTVAAEPIINRRLFINSDMILTYIMTVLHGSVLWSILYFLPLYYQGVKQMKPVLSAVAVLPETLTVAPAAGAVGVIAGITGRYRWSVWLGWALTVLGSGLLVLMRPDTSTAAWIWINVPVGLGTGMLFPALNLALLSACEPALNAQATAFFSFLRTFGQSIGVAISGVIFQNSFRKHLLKVPAFAGVADEYSHDATSIVAVIQAMPANAERAQLITAYNDSLRDIFYSMIAFSAFCLVLSAFLRGYSLNQEHVTDQGLVDRHDNSASGNEDTEKAEPQP